MTLPVANTQPQLSFYSTNNHRFVADRPDDRTSHFVSSGFLPGEDVTIAVGWQKGMILQSAYWRDWLTLHIGYVLSFLVLLGATTYSLIHWFFAEKFRKGRGTIIPEYEPPRALPPAMAQLIATERIGKSTWPATAVDLAVRGYVKIIKERKGASIGIPFFDRMIGTEGYRIEKVRDYQNDPLLQTYEKNFLDLLFDTVLSPNQNSFSTIQLKKKMRTSSTAVWFTDKVKKLAEALYEETSTDTQAYAIPLSAKARQRALGGLFSSWRIILAFLLFIGFFALTAVLQSSIQYGVLGLAIFVAALIILYATTFNPRLNEQGFLLRDDWRGFRLYLETAERYRMQNLTPDIFEKYLPYAMIFGIEKKWAKAFDSMNLQQPVWYGTAGYPIMAGYGGSGSASNASFSPSLFSTSFATSFTSAFASSGASGVGAGASGGGGAGGGGGGGGGGAS